MEPWRRFGTLAWPTAPFKKPRKTAPEAAIVRALGRRSVVLVGMMGAGKSSVGRRLAARLGIPFVDADAEIENAAGMTIPEIFAKHGEPYFRAGEARVIARLLDSGPQVLATGGGAFMNQDTRDLIRDKGISVWLKADLDVLLKRIKRRSDRPLAEQDPGPAAAARAGLCAGRYHRAVARRAARHHRRRDRRRAAEAARPRRGGEQRHDRAAAPACRRADRGQGRAGRARLRHRHRPRPARLARARASRRCGRAPRRDRHRRDRRQHHLAAAEAALRSGRHRQLGASSCRRRGLQELRDLRDACARRSSRRGSSAAIWSSRSAAA